MVVLVPKPRMLTGCAVGWSWPVGMLGSQTPGMRLTIWSTPVSGSAWICSRVISVVLTSSLSSAEPRPALTVMGGRLTGACFAGWAGGGVVLRLGQRWDQREARECGDTSPRER